MLCNCIFAGQKIELVGEKVGGLYPTSQKVGGPVPPFPPKITPMATALQTDTQTNRHTYHNNLQPLWGEVKIQNNRQTTAMFQEYTCTSTAYESAQNMMR